MSDQPTIPVGYVRRAHGIRGDVVVRGLVRDAAERLVAGATLTTGDAPPRTFAVTAHRPQRDDVVLHLAGVDDRNAAEALVGTQFVIGADQRRTLASDEWWVEDLEGCRVTDRSGALVGTVVDAIAGAAQDRLVVETPDGRRGEVPLVDAIVPVVDPIERSVVVELPDGLFD